jgi:hypothetical protein
MRPFGPKSADHPSVGQECPACRKPFRAGDYTTLVSLGPGDSEDSQRECREGKPYCAAAVEVHWSCATGQEAP